jgi:hypothetical protein
VEAADLLGIGQPRVSELKRGRLNLFSLEKLIEFARALGNEVQILVKSAVEPRLKVRTEGGPSPIPGNIRTSTYEYMFGSGGSQIATGSGMVVFDDVNAANIEESYWSRIQAEPTRTLSGLPLSSEWTVAAHLAWRLGQGEG